MSDYIQDMSDATELFKKWADTHAIMDDDYQVIDDLLRKHYDNRNDLFEIMVKILEQTNDELRDNWEQVCERALDQLDHLNGAIPSRAAEGLSGIGLRNFFEGEKKIWQENKKGTIATIAEVISEIGENDEALAKQLEEDLNKAREDGKVIGEASREYIGNVKDQAKELIIQAMEKAANKVVSEIPLVGEKLAPLGSKLVDAAANGDSGMRELRKRLQTLKEVVINNRKKIDDLKDKISDDNIRNTCRVGLDFADSLRGIGSNGDYRASDWERFANQCKERLKNRSDPAIEKAQHLFREVRPALVEGLTGAFATVLGNPDMLKQLNVEFDSMTKQVFEALNKDREVLQALKDSSVKQKGWETLLEIQNKVLESLKQLGATLKSAEEDANTY
jgi:hypothetical protein